MSRSRDIPAHVASIVRCRGCLGIWCRRCFEHCPVCGSARLDLAYRPSDLSWAHYDAGALGEAS